MVEADVLVDVDVDVVVVNNDVCVVFDEAISGVVGISMSFVLVFLITVVKVSVFSSVIFDTFLVVTIAMFVDDSMLFVLASS